MRIFKRISTNFHSWPSHKWCPCLRFTFLSWRMATWLIDWLIDWLNTSAFCSVQETFARKHDTCSRNRCRFVVQDSSVYHPCYLCEYKLLWSVNTGLIQLRNEMAHYIRHSSEKAGLEDVEDRHWPFGRLPQPINNERTCARCPQLLACSIYQRSVYFSAFQV